MWKYEWEGGISLRSTTFYEERTKALERLGIPIPAEDQKVIENREKEKVKVISYERGQAFEEDYSGKINRGQEKNRRCMEIIHHHEGAGELSFTGSS